MKKVLMTAMMTSISEVMETMFFLPVEFGDELTLSQCGLDESKSNMASQLNFSGDVAGNLCIIASKDLVVEMTENFMGESRENLTREHLLGTLTEMLNMVCGNALSKTESTVPFKLDIPKIIDESKILKKKKFTIVETTQSKMAVLLTID